MSNQINSQRDEYRVETVILNKALLGQVPNYFRIEGDSRLHPVLWYTHPHLTEIVFSDGSTSYVNPIKPSPGFAATVGPVPDAEVPAEAESTMNTILDEIDSIGEIADGVPLNSLTGRLASFKAEPENE